MVSGCPESIAEHFVTVSGCPEALAGRPEMGGFAKKVSTLLYSP